MLSGPLWVGPLQDREHLALLLAMAEQRGWAGRDSCAEALPWTKKGGVRSLGELLQLLLEESDARLPPWYALQEHRAALLAGTGISATECRLAWQGVL